MPRLLRLLRRGRAEQARQTRSRPFGPDDRKPRQLRQSDQRATAQFRPHSCTTPPTDTEARFSTCMQDASRALRRGPPRPDDQTRPCPRQDLPPKPALAPVPGTDAGHPTARRPQDPRPHADAHRPASPAPLPRSNSLLSPGYQITLTGMHLRQYPNPGMAPEGITTDPESILHLAEDAHPTQGSPSHSRRSERNCGRQGAGPSNDPGPHAIGRPRGQA